MQSNILEKGQLELKEAGSAVVIKSDNPHFIGLSDDDPFSSGIVLYNIHEGVNTVGQPSEIDLESDSDPSHVAGMAVANFQISMKL